MLAGTEVQRKLGGCVMRTGAQLQCGSTHELAALVWAGRKTHGLPLGRRSWAAAQHQDHPLTRSGKHSCRHLLKQEGQRLALGSAAGQDVHVLPAAAESGG